MATNKAPQGENNVEWRTVNIKDVKPNPKNPRVIRDKQYEKLKKSLQDDPQMLWARPIIVDKEFVVLGGNMRLRVLQDLKYKMIPIGISDWDEKQNDSFTIKDNNSYGEWDWEALANQWDTKALSEWMDIPEEWGFEPELSPTFSDESITQEEIESKARELAEQMVKEITYKEIMCPACGHEFEIGE